MRLPDRYFELPPPIPKRETVAASAQKHNPSAPLAARRAPGLDDEQKR
jgi:hypothetical protein